MSNPLLKQETDIDLDAVDIAATHLRTAQSIPLTNIN